MGKIYKIKEPMSKSALKQIKNDRAIKNAFKVGGRLAKKDIKVETVEAVTVSHKNGS